VLEPGASPIVPETIPVGRKIARNAASILLGDAASDVLVAMAIALAAVKLGPSGFGRLTEAQAFMEPFESLAGLGLGSVAITVAAKRGCDGALRGSVLAIRMVSALVAAIVGMAAAVATGRASLLPIIAIIAVGFFITPITMQAALPYQVDQAIHRRIIIPFLTSTVRLSTAYLAYWLYNKPVGYQLSGLASAIASASLGALWASKHYPTRLAVDRELIASLLKLGWPAAVLEFVVMAYSRLSYFLLHDAGPAVQGEYAAADRLIAPFLGLAGAVVISSLPTLATLAGEHRYAELTAAYRRSLIRVVAILVPVAALAWLLTGFILRNVVPEYAGATWPFRILSIGAVFMFLNQMSSSFIIALGRFRLIMVVALLNFVVYVALATQLIPRYRAVGAAISTATMEGVNTLMQIVIVFMLLSDARRSKPPISP
jgi:O-antigen/teichoic acid export membrane protein